jgi:hypothetical protein
MAQDGQLTADKGRYTLRDAVAAVTELPDGLQGDRGNTLRRDLD